MWSSLLSRVSLIDSITSECTSEGVLALNADVVPLAQLRPKPIATLEESLAITWLKDGVALDSFENYTSVLVEGDMVGRYTVKVRYASEEIRLEKEDLLTATLSLDVARAC